MVSQNNQYCPSCGGKLEPGDKFCAGCGFSVQNYPTKEGPVQPVAQTKSNKTKPVFILIAALIIIPLVLLASRNSVTTGTKKAMEDKLALAEKYLLDQEYEQAILAYREVIDIAPKEERAYTGLGKVYTVQEDYESAEEVLIEGIQIVDQKIPLRRDLADIYVTQEKYEEAEKEYLKILEEDENEQSAYRGLAGVYKRCHEVGKAIEVLEQAISKNPEFPENYSLLAEAYVVNDMAEKALEMVKKALKLDINHYNVFYVLDSIYSQSFDELQVEAYGMLEGEPDSLTGLMFQFYSLFKLEQYNEIIYMYENLYERTESMKVLSLAALAYQREEEINSAKELISLLDIDALDETNILLDLVHYFKDKGDHVKAVELAARALSIDKLVYESYLLLYELTGDELYLDRLRELGVEPEEIEEDIPQSTEPLNQNDNTAYGIQLLDDEDEIIAVLGAPLQRNLNYDEGFEEYHLQLVYPLGELWFLNFDGRYHCYHISIHSPGANGPRNIHVGDFYETVLRRFLDEGYPVNNNERILYSSEYVDTGVGYGIHGYVSYDDRGEPEFISYGPHSGGMGSIGLHITIQDGKVIKIGLGIQLM
ncbi:tetratricopeptide repeat protein [Candidatus Contubernalis alkaliaceticus]|uniref:tetratricopeptide repeat protein n=1 Tax=Candidatus Contubernalis alkaliaceticus TaxID=338645 RepID=UPI001F4C1BFA|nr:tetratricopeptide repeat protein [Candidatus Contubernalis alkalaceticus]UNC91131.1 tetratricopeptide repeat protein [Candidatus Contubernalis alkalaceticus]